MLPTILLSLVLTASRADAVAPLQAPDQPLAASDAVDETRPVDVPAPSEKALVFHRSGNVLWAVNQVWSLLMLTS